MKSPHFFGEICAQRYANQQICHAVAPGTRVNQGVGPWVLQQALASFCIETPYFSSKTLIHKGNSSTWPACDSRRLLPDSGITRKTVVKKNISFTGQRESGTIVLRGFSLT